MAVILAINLRHQRVDEAAIQVHNSLRQLENWLTTNSMSTEWSKSSLTVVTPFSQKYTLTLTVTLMSPSISVKTDKNKLFNLPWRDNSALRIDTGCIRSTPAAHLHAGTKSPSYERLLGSEKLKAIFCRCCPSAFIAQSFTRRHVHTISNSRNTALCVMILLLLGKIEHSWMHESFAAKAQAPAPPNTLLGESPSSISPD